MGTMRTIALLTLTASACAGHAVSPEPAPQLTQAVDLDDLDQAALAFVRARGSTDGQEVFFHWSGELYELWPGQPLTSRDPLLRFEGFNVARTFPLDEGGWRVVSREITVYQDADGQIVDCWVDPRAGDDHAPLPVVHIRNDPVSFDLRTPSHVVHDDRVVWSVTVPLAYPSALPVAEHPEHSAGDLYQSMELFDFEVGVQDLAADTPGVPARITWARIGQWLPWMGRGQQPGWLVYHATGRKLAGGWDDLPESLRAWTLDNAPEYQHAPAEDQGPNQTSWSVFREALEAGAIPEACVPGE
jgi:hypothetical protein